MYVTLRFDGARELRGPLFTAPSGRRALKAVTTCFREDVDGKRRVKGTCGTAAGARRARKFATQEQDPGGGASRGAFTRAPAILIHPIYRTFRIRRFGS